MIVSCLCHLKSLCRFSDGEESFIAAGRDCAACAADVKTGGSKGVPALDKAEMALLPPTAAVA